MFRFRVFPLLATMLMSLGIGGVSEISHAAPASAACCLIAEASAQVIAPNANTHIVINGSGMLSNQPLTVYSNGMFPITCSGPTSSPYGLFWSCPGIDTWYVALGNASNELSAVNAAVNVAGGKGSDTISVNDSPGARDWVDCGYNDGVRDYIHRDGQDVLKNCGNDSVGA